MIVFQKLLSTYTYSAMLPLSCDTNYSILLIVWQFNILVNKNTTKHKKM
jgi:hypothetical protein